MRTAAYDAMSRAAVQIGTDRLPHADVEYGRVLAHVCRTANAIFPMERHGWWTHTAVRTNPHSEAWARAGRTATPNLSARTVPFERFP